MSYVHDHSIDLDGMLTNEQREEANYNWFLELFHWSNMRAERRAELNEFSSESHRNEREEIRVQREEEISKLRTKELRISEALREPKEKRRNLEKAVKERETELEANETNIETLKEEIAELSQSNKELELENSKMRRTVSQLSDPASAIIKLEREIKERKATAKRQMEEKEKQFQTQFQARQKVLDEQLKSRLDAQKSELQRQAGIKRTQAVERLKNEFEAEMSRLRSQFESERRELELKIEARKRERETLEKGKKDTGERVADDMASLTASTRTRFTTTQATPAVFQMKFG